LSWWAIGAAALGCCILAGHPQIAVYTLVVAGIFGIFNVVRLSVSQQRLRLDLLLLYGSLFAAGIAMTAIQVLPMADLAARSGRAQRSFADFITYNPPPSHLVLALFPHLFGPDYEAQPIYFGRWNFTELTCYFGASTFVAMALLFGYRGEKAKIFLWGLL